MKVAIQLTKLTKVYPRSKVPAVDHLSLAIKPGEVYGLLGSNGAGKSTTIRSIMDFIRPTSGAVTVFGKNIQDHGEALRKHIGYLPGDVVLPKRTTGKDLLHYLASIGGEVDAGYLHDLTQRFDAQLDKPTQTLSKGNRQKIGLLQAFMHQPDILILDEPTSGLDPLMQEQFYRLINEARQRGAAILLSSHSFDEVDRVCDRVGILRDGKLVYEGSVAELRAARPPRWRVTLRKQADVALLRASPALNIVRNEGTIAVVEPTGEINHALAALAKVSISSMVIDQRELEDEFLSFYEADQQEAA